jgi:hypothetical protein
MREVSPAIVDRIVRDLSNSGATRSSADLAREHLGLGLIDEGIAERLLGPVLSADPRVRRAAAGWSAAGSGAGPADSGGIPLDAPHLVVAAPRAAEGDCAEVRVGSGEPRYAVVLGGAEELAAYRQGRGVPAELQAVPLARVARRLRGYCGPADPVRIAEVLGAPHLEAEGLGGWTAAVADVWEHLRADLGAEGVEDLDGLDRLLAESAEPPDFAGKRLSAEQIRELPERPGVYVFRNASGRPLYVGQSGNLRARVWSYFVGPPRDDKDRFLRLEAHALTVRPADTGLDAWIDELQTIRRLRPRLNTRRRVGEEAPEDGWLLVPDPARPGRAVMFSLWEGRLSDRRVIPATRGRRPAAVADALAGRGRLADRPVAAAAGRLARTWHRMHPTHPLLRLGIDGSRAQIAATVLAHLDELEGS